MHTGNDYGFICGQYDGTQNNNGYLFTYASHTFPRDSRMDRSGTVDQRLLHPTVRNSNVWIHRNVITGF